MHNPVLEDFLMHYGTKRHSGRYPWGSGENPYQHSGDFISRVSSYKDQGYTEKQIADEFGISILEYRTAYSVANHYRRQLQVEQAKSLRSDGKTLDEIASIMGFKNDSSVRALLNENTEKNKTQAMKTKEILKAEVEKKGVIDVGAGVANELGVSDRILEEAIYMLEAEEGYFRSGIGVPQVTNAGKQINTEVLCKSEDAWKAAYKDKGLIKSVSDDYHSTDGGKTYNTLQYPESIDSSRVSIRYGDQGGSSKDGVIEIRPGVADLDLGNSSYAQVRILVDGDHYLKGMAVYSDSIPDGSDIVFNTNKNSSVDKMSVLKKAKTDDALNPFGASIKANGQSTYVDSNGVEHLSAINKLKEEGDWNTSSSKNLSQQFLSKQPMKLINQQLKQTYADVKEQYDEICALTNPTVKRKMLNDFANECDAKAVHLKAAALPRQSTNVILPCDSLKETEIYAPNYNNGEQVALIRYPHAGTFEIPVLTVNNKNKGAIETLGTNLADAVGINSAVAERLSGADFDGDQVVVIPTNNEYTKIKSTPTFKGMLDKDGKMFDPKTAYSSTNIGTDDDPVYVSDTTGKEIKIMSEAYKQKQMGVVSNLITDMTLKGATEDEIVRAVKHSMVVIDAVKHELDYKQSEKDNGIAELKQKYQGGGGASTLLSKRKQDEAVPERQGSGKVNLVGKSYYDPSQPEGALIYKTSGRTYVDENGNTVEATTKVKRILNTPDVRTLSSGTSQENAYADYANNVKALANEARKEAATTPRLVYSASAKAAYKEEVASLDAKLNIAKLNAPRERQAQAIANSIVTAKKQSNPELTLKENKDALKKIKNQALQTARTQVGANGKGTRISITDKEWEAIQAGAISDNKLTQILRYADDNIVKQLATPKSSTGLSSAQLSLLRQMASNGYTNAEIAKRLGISTSTVSKYLNS